MDFSVEFLTRFEFSLIPHRSKSHLVPFSVALAVQGTQGSYTQSRQKLSSISIAWVVNSGCVIPGLLYQIPLFFISGVGYTWNNWGWFVVVWGRITSCKSHGIFSGISANWRSSYGLSGNGWFCDAVKLLRSLWHWILLKLVYLDELCHLGLVLSLHGQAGRGKTRFAHIEVGPCLGTMSNVVVLKHLGVFLCVAPSFRHCENQHKGGRGEAGALLHVVFKELCEVNMIFVKWRWFSWTVMWGKMLCRWFKEKKGEKSLYFIKVCCVGLSFKCVFGGLYRGV